MNTRQADIRVSVFLPSPSDKASTPPFSGFKVDPMEPADGHFISELQRAKDQLDTREVHLTGGEPTQHRNLPEVVRTLKDMGMRVKMTSNGETGSKPYAALAEAGLDSVSFSIFGSTPEEYAATQPALYNNTRWASFKLARSKDAIAAAREEGIDVKANCVMSDASHSERITRLIRRAHEEGFSLRILNDLGEGQESIAAIYNLLADLDAKPTRRKLVRGVSGAVSYFELPSGQEIGFKQIRNERLPSVCDGCPLDKEGKCEEGYYGIRLYKKQQDEQQASTDENPYAMGVCIQRMDLAVPTDVFYASTVPQEIKALRETGVEDASNPSV